MIWYQLWRRKIVSGKLVTCFNEDTDGILLGIDKRIYIGFSDETFEGFNDENIEVIVTGVRYGINGDVG